MRHKMDASEIEKHCEWCGEAYTVDAWMVARRKYCSRQCAGLALRRPLEFCVQCTKSLTRHQGAKWRYRAGMSGPYCSNQCQGEARRIYANHAEKSKNWHENRLGAGICIECGAGHDRGKFRCVECTRKRTAHQSILAGAVSRVRCGICGNPGHNRKTCTVEVRP